MKFHRYLYVQVLLVSVLFGFALAATLGAVSHIPIAGLALLIGIDRFMSKARALTNLCGNAVAMIVVAMWALNQDLAPHDEPRMRDLASSHGEPSRGLRRIASRSASNSAC